MVGRDHLGRRIIRKGRIMKVVFFNFYHNGDIHVSRGLVREIAKHCQAKGIPCEYYHPNTPGILADIPYVKHTTNGYGLNPGYRSALVGDTLFINTWYCGKNEIYQAYGITFDCLYLSFKESAKLLDLDLGAIPGIDLFPNIDYNYFQIGKAKEWLDVHHRPRVLISNGHVLSGQATNFSFATIVNQLAKSHDHIDFLISNADGGIVQAPNVFLTSNIIQSGGFDLNENSYLASHCSAIIGRCSGAYSFSITKENYWDNPKTFVAFTNLSMGAAIWTKQFTPPPNAKIVVHDVSDDSAIGLIAEHLPVR